MSSIIKGKNEIVEIAQRIAKGMGIEKEEISSSDRLPDIFILAVREYDDNQRELERKANEEV